MNSVSFYHVMLAYLCHTSKLCFHSTYGIYTYFIISVFMSTSLTKVKVLCVSNCQLSRGLEFKVFLHLYNSDNIVYISKILTMFSKKII